MQIKKRKSPERERFSFFNCQLSIVYSLSPKKHEEKPILSPQKKKNREKRRKMKKKMHFLLKKFGQFKKM